ncbi:MAG: hypothetical protein E7596_08645 [Ruminococcaceae bacterium]|nr:hypothetical protein [Oscillospiraceae bacterium]
MKKKDIFDEKTSWKYTAISHIRIAQIKDTVLDAFSATSSLKIIKNTVFSAPPPSSIDTGYRFINAKEKLPIMKNSYTSPRKNGINRTIIAEITLKIIPPNWTNNSFRYVRLEQSYDKLRCKGPILSFRILAPISLDTRICPSS